MPNNQGLYIHIPFCKQKCHYCNFHFSTRFEGYRKKMIESIALEIQSRKHEQVAPISSVYWGGGSPSLLTANELLVIWNSIQQHYHFAKTIEHTIEVNPDDVDAQKIADWKTIQINRVSLGVQSFNENDLTRMNRAHNPTQAIQSIQQLQAAQFNLSIDLIFALPYQNSQAWINNLSIAVEQFKIQHLSCYNLTIEEKTALANWKKNNTMEFVEEITAVELFTLTQNYLNQHGYEQYEISNYAKNNAYAQHNLSYWEKKAYIGFGPSAHSYNLQQRRWNISNNSKYIQHIQKGGNYFTTENLSKQDHFNEQILTGLRLNKGINIAILQSTYPEYYTQIQTKLKQLKQEKLLNINTHLQLTKSGKLLADDVCSSLFVVD